MERHLNIPIRNQKIQNNNFIAMTLVKVNHPINKSFDGLFNQLFNEFPAGFGKAVREDVLDFPPVNIVEQPNGYQLSLSAPGLDKSDFSIKLENRILTISAEKKEEKLAETDKYVRKEFSRKAFKRSFTVDEKIDDSHISAKYENGVLVLDLPKKEEVKSSPTAISIQ